MNSVIVCFMLEYITTQHTQADRHADNGFRVFFNQPNEQTHKKTMMMMLMALTTPRSRDTTGLHGKQPVMNNKPQVNLSIVTAFIKTMGHASDPRQNANLWEATGS